MELTLANRALGGEGLPNPSAVKCPPKECQWHCKGGQKRGDGGGGVEKIIAEPERNVICSDTHEILKRRALVLVQRKPGVFALLLFAAQRWEERGWA